MATQIPLDQIVDNPFQSRSTYDRENIQSLADEMEAEGFWSGTPKAGAPTTARSNWCSDIGGCVHCGC